MDNLIVKENYSIKKAMAQMDKNARKIVYVVSDDDALVGSLSDGDVRRWILRDYSVEEPVNKAMNPEPSFLTKNDYKQAKKLMDSKKINSIPVIDKQRKIKNILFPNNEWIKKEEMDIPVVIMAGGKGTRLYPYTKILPKPLIPIGDTPIMERIIDKYVEYGFNQFLISVNYKKNMIKNYFQDFEHDYKIKFIDEDNPLGTGGSLSLMKEDLTDDFFVSNCDILVEADYKDVVDFHQKNKNDVTIIASLKTTEIPYGVLKLDDEGLLDTMVEKPQYTHLINTGMYLMNASILDFIPENEFVNLPDAILEAKNAGLNVGVFPVSEDAWLDMGQIKEMENMIETLEVNK